MLSSANGYSQEITIRRRFILPVPLLRRFSLIALTVLLSFGCWTAQAGTDDYRLGSGDLLKINVFDHPELSVDVRVSESGKLTFPLLGEIGVGGLSTREFETMLIHRLDEGGYVRGAQVSVLVVEYLSQKIAVMGQVTRPGQYSLQSANRVVDLLAQAGGVINTSAGDQVTVLRKDGSKVSLDLAALFDGDPSQNPVVAAGDTIYVPRAPQFYIYGQVQRPGAYRLERRMTVTQAIAAGGGLTPKGSEHRMTVKRRDSKGVERTVSVAGSDLLQADDVLSIKEGWF